MADTHEPSEFEKTLNLDHDLLQENTPENDLEKTVRLDSEQLADITGEEKADTQTTPDEDGMLSESELDDLLEMLGMNDESHDHKLEIEASDDTDASLSASPEIEEEGFSFSVDEDLVASNDVQAEQHATTDEAPVAETDSGDESPAESHDDLLTLDTHGDDIASPADAADDVSDASVAEDEHDNLLDAADYPATDDSANEPVESTPEEHAEEVPLAEAEDLPEESITDTFASEDHSDTETTTQNTEAAADSPTDEDALNATVAEAQATETEPDTDTPETVGIGSGDGDDGEQKRSSLPLLLGGLAVVAIAAGIWLAMEDEPAPKQAIHQYKPAPAVPATAAKMPTVQPAATDSTPAAPATDATTSDAAPAAMAATTETPSMSDNQSSPAPQTPAETSDTGASPEVMPDTMATDDTATTAVAETTVATGNWTVFGSSHGNRDAAEAEQAQLQKKSLSTEIQQAEVKGKTWYRLVLGNFADKAAALAFIDELKNNFGITDTWMQHNKVSTPNAETAPADAQASGHDWVVNVSSYRKPASALVDVARLKAAGLDAQVREAEARGAVWQRVVVAGLTSHDDAKALIQRLSEEFHISGAWAAKD